MQLDRAIVCIKNWTLIIAISMSIFVQAVVLTAMKIIVANKFLSLSSTVIALNIINRYRG